jgi:prefoldin beta subunit
MSSDVTQLHLLQQNLDNVLTQKQQMESQLIELNSAIGELKDTKQAYKIVGKIMIATNKEEVSKDLQEKKEVTQVRLNNLEKQVGIMKIEIEKLKPVVKK